MTRILIAVAILVASFLPQRVLAQEQPTQFPWQIFIPLATAQLETFVLVNDYEELVVWFAARGIAIPDEEPQGRRADELSTFLLGCDEGDGAYVVFRVGPGTMNSVFSTIGLDPGETLVNSYCDGRFCMGGHLLRGQANVRILSHTIFGLFSARHLFGGCT